MMLKVEDVMSEDLISCRPDDKISELAILMAKYDIGAIPICNDEDQLVGIVTDRDLVIRGYAASLSAETKIEKCMTVELVTCDVEMSVTEAGELMSEHQIRRLPVMKDGQLIGMVSLADLANEQFADQIASEALEDISEHDHFH